VTSSDPRQRFLELEAQADELVKTLENLKSESENYSSASGRLDDVSKHVQETLEAMNSASLAMKDTASTLNAIGTPEILASQETQANLLEAQATSLNGIDTRLTELEAKLDDVGTQSKRSLLARLITFS
jgi:uncharacterized coiled-coil DUF342 family protein